MRSNKIAYAMEPGKRVKKKKKKALLGNKEHLLNLRVYFCQE